MHCDQQLPSSRRRLAQSSATAHEHVGKFASSVAAVVGVVVVVVSVVDVVVVIVLRGARLVDARGARLKDMNDVFSKSSVVGKGSAKHASRNSFSSGELAAFSRASEPAH